MFDSNWNHIIIENVFPVYVPKEEIGKKIRTFGETKFYQLGIKFEGETEIFYNKKKITFSAGDVLFLPKENRADIPYNKTFIKSGTGICIFFNSDHFLHDKPVLFKNGKFVESLYRQICNSHQRKDNFKTLSLFYEIISFLNESISEKSKLDCATAYIADHINDSFIDLQLLAQQSGVSEDYFRHLFKQIYGVSPTQYIAEQKIICIKDHLLTSGKNIKEISRLSGFRDQNYFSRFFKKHTGLTPGEFKKRYGTIY